uniref:Reverse transcriptase domain-containing protein n=1 Tax=Tanacetum cinerariifolium TaxID=118510 RepID=A0A699GIJ1_TANCI|nr:reverse transcriptase domain-containing protein [Tanacetum cinerariifolium]
MIGPTPNPVTPANLVTRNDDNPNNSPSLQDQILDHMASLKALIKHYNEKSETLMEPIRLTFGDEEDGDKLKAGGKGTEEEKDEDLQKPYKEFTLRRKCCKDPTEVSKIIRRANEMLPDFKERWIETMSYIQDVSKEILATKLQLQLPLCPPMIETPKKENLDRHCEYHGDKGHRTNDCYQLRRQLEATLEFGKLRQRENARGRQPVNNNGKGKVINMAKGLKTEQKWVFLGSVRSRVLNIQDEDEVVNISRACHWKEHEITVLTMPPSFIGPTRRHLYGSDRPIII